MCYDLPGGYRYLDFLKSSWLVMPFKRTFHIRLARNSPVENSTGDVMAWRRRRSLGRCTTSCIEARFAHF